MTTTNPQVDVDFPVANPRDTVTPRPNLQSDSLQSSPVDKRNLSHRCTRTLARRMSVFTAPVTHNESLVHGSKCAIMCSSLTKVVVKL